MYYGKFHLPEWATLCPLQEYYRHSTINYTSIKALFSVLHPLPQLYIYGRMDRSGPNLEESNRNFVYLQNNTFFNNIHYSKHFADTYTPDR